MNESNIQSIDRFLAQVERFRELWQSGVVRVGWVHAEDGADAVVYLHIGFSPLPAHAIKAPDAFPATKRFQVDWAVLDVAHVVDLVRNLRNDAIEVNGRSLKLRRYESNAKKWDQHYNFFENLDIVRSREPFCLEADLGPYCSPYQGQLRMPELEADWSMLPVPFISAKDVMENFFEFEPGRHTGENITVLISARMPIEFSRNLQFSGKRLSIEVNAPATVVPNKVSLNAVFEKRDGVIVRVPLEIPQSAWQSSGTGKKCSYEIDAEEFAKATLVLCYDGVVIGKSTVVNPFPSEINPYIAIHSCFDPGMARFKAWIAERTDVKKERNSNDFEVAVAWLFAFCGFSVLSYGQANIQSEVDVIAAALEHRVVLAVECSIDVSGNKDKLEKLYERAKKIKSELKSPDISVYAVLVTSLPMERVAPSVIEVATRNKTIVLAAEKLSVLERMAHRRESIPEMLKAILGELHPEKTAQWSSLLSGNS